MSDVTIDSDQFRKVLGRYPTGVTIVTALDDGEPVGMVIGTFVSVSLDPPLVGFLPARTSTTWPRIARAQAFCVNVLSSEQLDIGNSFFRKDGDPWSDLEWHEGVTGSPVLPHCVAHVECTIEDVFDAGDHWMVLGLVRDLDYSEECAGPLLFCSGTYGTYQAL